jgi:site-specific recombinase XerD
MTWASDCAGIWPGRVPAAWTPHWMRYSHATALLMAGVLVHVVPRRLGHRDVQTTPGQYAHVTEDADMRAVAKWRAGGTKDDD